MDKIQIIGGNPLEGSIKISGSKNASLPILASTLLTDKSIELLNIPNLSDIDSMINLLKSLDARIELNGENLKINCQKPRTNFASYELVRKMRASFLVLGPLLARYGTAEVSLPGGCAIGARPINIHLNGLEKLGAVFKIENGYVKGTVNGYLKGSEIKLAISSVGATENILMAATLAEGKTIIKNAAKEPEIIDLCNFLNKMGANISGAGEDIIEIIGTSKLSGCSYSIMPDRIEAGTYALSVLGCSGKVKLMSLNKLLINHLKDIFLNIESFKFNIVDESTIIIESNTLHPKGLNIKTEPFPGFPTDLQAQLTAALTKANGVSFIEETIFENRFMHISELHRMGAKILIEGSKVKIDGQKKLFGAEVMATDLRASSSLIIAGLMAEGKTTINRVYHLDRGYENIEKKLSECKVNIKRIKN